MKEWSNDWKASKNPRKQRKYTYNAPLHIKKNFVSVNLSKDLRQKHKTRNIQVKKGDSVIVLRGQFKKKTGKISRVDLRRTKVYIEGIETVKHDGKKVGFPFAPSNLQIKELNLEDRKRLKHLKGDKENAKSKTPQKA
ncbi:MAG: 50S ribosomal protein L24 [Candidatus Nanoarchaeia archaeon]|nr:50S ribosomal protein L24 [Candidatus Nanoarchaeia archaeon]